MSQLSTFAPRMFETQAQRASKAKELDGYSLSEAVGDAVSTEWVPAFLARQYERGAAPDPDFKGIYANDDLFKQFTNGLPEESWSAFDESVSFAHAMKIREQTLGVYEAKKRLASLGWGGVALQFGASMADPTQIAVAIATGGGSRGATILTAGQRVARMAKAGLVNVATSSPLEAYIASEDPTRNAGDVMLSAAASFALGGGVEAVVGSRRLRAMLDGIQNDVEYRDIIGATGALGGSSSHFHYSPEVKAMLRDEILTENGRLKFKRQVSDTDRRTLADVLIDNSGLDADGADDATVAALRAADPEDVLNHFGRALSEEPPARGVETPSTPIDTADGGNGGGRTLDTNKGEPPPPPPKTANDFSPTPTEATATFKGARVDMAGMLGFSDSPLTRFASAAFAQDSLLRKLHGLVVPATDSASEWVRRTFTREMTPWARDYYSAMSQWRNQNGYTWLRRFEGERIFNRAVRAATLSDSAFFHATPPVKKAAQATKDLMGTALGYMQRNGVRGAIEVAENPHYLMRVWKPERLADTINQLGGGKAGRAHLERFFANAIRASQPDIDPDLLKKISRGMITTILDKTRFTDLDGARMAMGDPEAIADVLRATVDGISDIEVEQAVRRLRPNPEAGVPSRLKSKVLLDDLYEESVRVGDQWVELRMADLVDDDAEMLAHTAMRQAVGASAEAGVFESVTKHLRGKETARLKAEGADAEAINKAMDAIDIRSFGQLRRALIADMEKSGVDANQIGVDLSKMETLWRSVRGMPMVSVGSVDPAGPVAKTLRTIRAFNYLRLQGGFGVAQAVEAGNIIGEAGVSVMLRQMPVFKDIIASAKTGKLSNEFLREIDAMLAPGNDRLLSSTISRLDDSATMSEALVGRSGQWIGRMNRAATEISLFGPIDQITRRMAAAAGVQKFLDQIGSGKMPSVKRLAAIGLSPSDYAAIAADAAKYVEQENGSFGKRIRRLNYDQWAADEPGTARKFQAAMQKWSERIIQTNDVGNMSQWMTTDWGKVILQFRSFVTAAWTKNTLHRVQMRDYQAFGGVAATSLLGSLAYIAQTYSQSLGRADAQEFREQRLTPGRIAAIGWSRGGSASILPQAFDFANKATGGDDPLFQPGRYTGLTSTGWAMNPTSALLDSALRIGPVAGNAVRSVAGGRPDTFTQSDARSMTTMLPFQKVFGIRNVIDGFVSRLPKEEPSP